MTIKIKIDEMRKAVKDSLSKYGLERVLQQECDRIVKKHVNAAIEEVKKLSVHIVTPTDFENMQSTLTIETNEPTTSSH